MARYIDADKALEKIKEFCRIKPSGDTFTDHFALFAENNAKQILEEVIKELPTADVAEVVRCRNCMHCEIVIDQFDNDWYFCKKTKDNAEVKPDDFCSYGERRDT